LKGKWHFGATFIDNAGQNVIGCIYLMNISMGFTYPPHFLSFLFGRAYYKEVYFKK
jgi:hypothetical protein